MKFHKQEPSPAGYNRYWFAIGDQEAVILHSLLERAYIAMPRTPETAADLQRINSMKRAMIKGVSDIDLTKYGENKKPESANKTV